MPSKPHEWMGVWSQTVPTLSRGCHCSFLYTSLDELRWLLVPFYHDGLEQGEGCTFYSSREIIEQLYGWLGEAGVNVPEVVESGQLACHSSLWTEAPDSADGCIEALQRILEPMLARYPAVRHAGDPCHLKSPMPSWEIIMEWEARGNLKSGRFPVKAICAYHLPSLDARILLHVLQTHPLNIQAGQIRQNPYLPPETFLEKLRSSS